MRRSVGLFWNYKLLTKEQRRIGNGSPLLFCNGHLGNGLTRLPWEQEILGSSPRCPTILVVLIFDNGSCDKGKVSSGYRPMVGPESSKLMTTVRFLSTRSKFWYKH